MYWSTISQIQWCLLSEGCCHLLEQEQVTSWGRYSTSATLSLIAWHSSAVPVGKDNPGLGGPRPKWATLCEVACSVSASTPGRSVLLEADWWHPKPAINRPRHYIEQGVCIAPSPSQSTLSYSTTSHRDQSLPHTMDIVAMAIYK